MEIPIKNNKKFAQNQQLQQNNINSDASNIAIDLNTLNVYNNNNIQNNNITNIRTSTCRRFSTNIRNQNQQRQQHQPQQQTIINQHYCRTPPPTYNSLLATPPPSYTPRTTNSTNVSIIAAPTDRQQLLKVLQHNKTQVIVERIVNGGNGFTRNDNKENSRQRRRRQLVKPLDDVVNRNEIKTQHRQSPDAAAVLQQELQHKQQQLQQQQIALHKKQLQQRQLRRRRLHLLQQQRLSNIKIQQNIYRRSSSSSNTSGSNTSGSNKSGSNTSGSNTSGNNISSSSSSRGSNSGIARINGLIEYNCPQPLECFRNAYYPDLLHVCSLILQQPPSSDSSLGSFTETPQTLSYSSEYAEICNICPTRAKRRNSCRLKLSRSFPELTACNINASIIHDEQVRDANLESQENTDTKQTREMGQALSLRRPHISLTWVLREQQQQEQEQEQEQQQKQQHQQQQKLQQLQQRNSTEQLQEKIVIETNANNNNNTYANGSIDVSKSFLQKTQPLSHSTLQSNTIGVATKKYRIKQIANSNTTEPVNGYATTPTTHPPINRIATSQRFFSNHNLLDFKDKNRTPSRELLFVCTPQRLPKSYESRETLALAKKSNEVRKRLASKIAVFQASTRVVTDSAEIRNNVKKIITSGPSSIPINGVIVEKEEIKSLKGTYSEPSLIAASEGNNRRHRHRKKREKAQSQQKFGYEINNVDDFLSKCSLTLPANIPVVLATTSILYQTRPGGYQTEIPLPIGLVVNAIFKNQNWLYIQTPHAEEGYVAYSSALPLGILSPPPTRICGNDSSNKQSMTENIWDAFTRPCGNLTDSEKEIRYRSGTRSDGARTPRGKRNDGKSNDIIIDKFNGNLLCSEHIDKWQSPPKLVEISSVQLKAPKSASIRSTNDEYTTLHTAYHQQQQYQQKQHQQQQLQQQQHLQQQNQQQFKSRLHLQKQKKFLQLQQKEPINGAFIANGQNGQHIHPKNKNMLEQYQLQQQQQQNLHVRIPLTRANVNLHQTAFIATRKQHGLRQTLVAINTDYTAESITLQKGEIVTLCECRESKDQRQWFYVKTRDGREGFIPAEVAGHGFL